MMKSLQHCKARQHATKRRENADNTSEKGRLARVTKSEKISSVEPTPLTNVLVIDNSVEVGDRLCAFLTELAAVHVVGCRANPEDVLPHFEALRPACVVMDVPMQDQVGFELLATLRRRDPECLLIILTNHVTEEFRHRSHAAGADHFFCKATEFERIVELVSSLQENL